MLIALAAMVLLQSTAADAQSDEIVVTARAFSCQAYLRGEAMSSRALAAYARKWRNGVPVRVRAPRRSDLRCRAQIAFRLGHMGIRLIEFVDPAD